MPRNFQTNESVFSQEINTWRIANDKKFSSKEIFREEFLAFINSTLFQKFQYEVDKI